MIIIIFVCSAGSILHDNINFGRTFIALNGDDYDLEELERQSMMYLIMHEVGHTLGLNHNMKSSSIFSPNELYDNNKLKGKAISGSVMDYPALNLNPNSKLNLHMQIHLLVIMINGRLSLAINPLIQKRKEMKFFLGQLILCLFLEMMQIYYTHQGE